MLRAQAKVSRSAEPLLGAVVVVVMAEHGAAAAAGVQHTGKGHACCAASGLASEIDVVAAEGLGSWGKTGTVRVVEGLGCWDEIEAGVVRRKTADPVCFGGTAEWEVQSMAGHGAVGEGHRQAGVAGSNTVNCSYDADDDAADDVEEEQVQVYMMQVEEVA